MVLQNRWVVITGGSSGIGLEMASQLAKRGNRITIIADEQHRLAEACSKLQALGGAVDAICCDIGRPEEIDELARTLLQDNAAPDVLVNNAGFATYRPFEAADGAEIDRIIAVNLVGHMRLTKALLGPMIARRSGAICFIASLAGRIPITPNAAYCAAKHGMMGLAEALRFELRRFGIEVTAVCPGRVNTAFFDHPTFRDRTRGVENKTSLSVTRTVQATIAAVERARFITYIPASLGIAAWLYEALPAISRPLYSRIMGIRIERLYADLNK